MSLVTWLCISTKQNGVVRGGLTGRSQLGLIPLTIGKLFGRQCVVTRHNFRHTISLSVCRKNSIKRYGASQPIIGFLVWSMEGEESKTICLRDCNCITSFSPL